MTTEGSSTRLKAGGRAFFVSLAWMSAILGQTACTRDEVASAISTVAVQLEATLEPWGATVAANAQAIESRLPAALATAKAPALFTVTAVPASSETPTVALESTATISPSPTTIPPTETATPTSTSTSTPLPTSTPTPTATPFPLTLNVPGGTMVLITGGFFEMGATADSLTEECNAFREGCQVDWFTASEPVHSVLLGRYYIDTHEVTNEAYASFLNSVGSDSACLDQPCLNDEQSQIVVQDGTFIVEEDQKQNPIAGVSWYGASAFCEWRDARLPTEAEWERAAVWDSKSSAARRYPWGNEFDGRLVNFCDSSCDAPQANSEYDDGFPEVAPVASFEGGVSQSGLYDMAGNVWEWVADWYDPTYYAGSSEAHPTGPLNGEEKVVRGGSWFDTGNFTTSAIRFPSTPDNTDRTIGFRCAADIP